MKKNITTPADILIAQIHKLFNHELGMQNDFLKLENKILRSKLGKRVPLNDNERSMLVRYGLRIREHLRGLISIVKPETLLAWHRRMKKNKWTFDNTSSKKGRPRISADTESLVVKMAQENIWGYHRISGEMKKLGHKLCPTTVKNILKKHGIPPVPLRKGMSWKKFIESHLSVLWAGDFFTEEVWTMKGLVTYYVLFFIHLSTRRVHIAGCTPNPNYVWTSQQARNFSMLIDEIPERCRYIIHDRDTPESSIDNLERFNIIKNIK